MTNLHAQCLELLNAGIDPLGVMPLAKYLSSPDLIDQTFYTSSTDERVGLYEGSLELILINDEWCAVAPSQL